MYASDFVQPFNNKAHCSEDLALRLPAWQVFSYDHAETPVHSVSDRLHFWTLPDFDDKAEASCIFNSAVPSNAAGSPDTVIDFNPNPKDVTFTGTMTPGRNGQGSQTLYPFTGVQHG